MESNIVRYTVIIVSLESVEMAKMLFGKYVFSAKPLNKTSYSDCNTV